MSVKIEQKKDDNSIVISVSGRFDFSLHTLFRNAYKDVCLESGVFVIDLANAEYLDSSALGMLLLVKEHAESMSSNVIIKNPGEEILEILRIASFDKLFDIK